MRRASWRNRRGWILAFLAGLLVGSAHGPAGPDCQERPTTPEPGADEVAQHARQRRVGREVPKEAGRLPVRDPRHDDPVEVRQHRFHVLRLLRGVGGEPRPDLPGLHLGHHRPTRDALAVVGDPVDQAVAQAAELIRGHARCSGWVCPVANGGGEPIRSTSADLDSYPDAATPGTDPGAQKGRQRGRRDGDNRMPAGVQAGRGGRRTASSPGAACRRLNRQPAPGATTAAG